MKNISTQKHIIKTFAIALLCFSCTQHATATFGSLFGNKESKQNEQSPQAQDPGTVNDSMRDAGQQMRDNNRKSQELNTQAENLASGASDFKKMARQVKEQQQNQSGWNFFSTNSDSSKSGNTNPPSPVSDDGRQLTANEPKKSFLTNPFAKKAESADSNIASFNDQSNMNPNKQDHAKQDHAKPEPSSVENMANNPQAILQREKEVAVYLLGTLSDLIDNEQSIVFGSDADTNKYRNKINEIKEKIAQTIQAINGGAEYKAQPENSFVSMFKKSEKQERVAEVLPNNSPNQAQAAAQIEDVLRRHGLRLLLNCYNIVQCLIALPGTDEHADRYLKELQQLIENAGNELFSNQSK